MPSTPPDIGQPTRGARTGREDRGERGNKWWTLVAVSMGTFMLLLEGGSRMGRLGQVEQTQRKGPVRLKINEGNNVFVLVSRDQDQAAVAGAQMLPPRIQAVTSLRLVIAGR